MSAMTQAVDRTLTFMEFLESYPEAVGRYELIEGTVVEIQAIGPHELITSFVGAALTLGIRRLHQPYVVSHNTLIKVEQPQQADSAHVPDVIVLDRDAIANAPY